jgi:abortive infection bacteriophage resistance protein
MKVFKTFRQQLRILRNRGLTVPKDGKPMKVLQEENYYALINGYKELFIGANASAVDQSETFIPGSTFEEIYSLSIFDRNIRAILLKSILKAENQFKSFVSYEFSKNHGHDNYLKKSSFDDSHGPLTSRNAINDYEKKIERINKVISDVQRNISYYYKKKSYIKHYVNEYGFVPLWVLVNTMSFGTISTFYSLMKPAEQVNISRNYNLLKETLGRYMKVLSEARNVCAHDERLYNIVLSKESEIRDTRYHTSLGIPIVNTKYSCGKKDFFAILITLKEILKKREFTKLINEIYTELNKISSKLSSVSINDLMAKMGLPSNWKQLSSI